MKVYDAQAGGLRRAVCKGNGFTGFYCLGTIKKFRGLCIAHGIRGCAQARPRPFLHALRSEGRFNFYTKSGFKPAYSKHICLLPRPKA